MADPHDPEPALNEHRQSCHDCNLYTERLLRFESRLARALSVPAQAQEEPTSRVVFASPPGTAAHAGAEASRSDNVVPLRAKSSRAARHSPAYRRGWLAMAASVVMALVVAGGLWLSVPDRSLAAEVVTHMKDEPQAWLRTDVPVQSAALQGVLRDSHLRLTAAAGVVSYASSCGFRGHRVPHLVLQTESGPITVMVLVHERFPKPMQFDEQGYRGVIVPVAGHGSLAVLTRGPATDINTVEHIASRVLGSIVWTG